MDLIGFNGSMENNHLMEDAGNVYGEVKKVSCVDRNFWWEAVSHPCAKWRSPFLEGIQIFIKIRG